MSLSREVARWIHSQPGAIYGYSDKQVWELARTKFMQDRRWKAECPMDAFIIHMNNCGYNVATRDNTAKERPDQPDHYHILQLPEGSRGF